MREEQIGGPSATMVSAGMFRRIAVPSIPLAAVRLRVVGIGRPAIKPTSVHVNRASPVRLDVGGDGADEGLPGNGDYFVSRF